MPQTLHISVPDNLHGELLKLADADFKKLGEYCKDVLIKHVKVEIEKAKLEIEPKPRGRPADEKTEWLKKEKLLRQERNLHRGRTVDEWVDFFSGPYESITGDYLGTADLNLPYWLEKKAEKDKVPLEELQAKYKAQKPRPTTSPKQIPVNSTDNLDEILASLGTDEGEE